MLRGICAPVTWAKPKGAGQARHIRHPADHLAIDGCGGRSPRFVIPTQLVSAVMPFTPAHIAAVLPLRGRAGLPFAALAAGSMSPDLTYYLPGEKWVPTPATHSFWGIVTWDLLFGLLMWVVWCLAREPLFDLAPQSIRSRWSRAKSKFWGWRSAPLAVLIGSTSHVVWDEFTHVGRFGATHFAVLANTYPSPLGPLEGFRYLQYASGVFGLLLLSWAWFRSPTVAQPDRSHPLMARLSPLVVVSCGCLAVALRLVEVGWTDWRSAAFAMATSGIGGVVIATAALCIGYSALSRSQP